MKWNCSVGVLTFFFGSFDLYQDKRNEHEWVFENRMDTIVSRDL